ncbi:unnamed protein product [Paramecium primaurelia]|uniref:Uncharacterized protein n=1 Tax=Paramecium primaurelia TaxID=5886 RepID=A0A8S1NZ86_PARPR|nr:unnamed protein product [Paramecium primaurelia]
MSVNQIIEQVLASMLDFENTDFKLSKKSQILELIEREELLVMERQWPPKRLNMVEFIKLMIPIVHHKQSELLYLVMGLIELYKDVVAISQQNELSLQDVTSYVCQVDTSENTMVPQRLISDPKKFNLNKTRIREIDVESAKIIGSSDNEIFHIVPNSLQNDSIRHHNGIVHTGVYCNKQIITLDSLDSKINIYHVDGSLKQMVKISQHEDKETIILSFAWSDRQQRIGLTLKSHSICMYEGDFKKYRIFSTVMASQEYQTNIWFLENQNQWVTTDSTFRLYFWDLLNESANLIFQNKCIQGNIIECVEVVHMKMIATASLDKQVALWDIQNGEIKITLSLKDYGGIHSLVYSYYYQVFITCGYSTYINVYDINPKYHDVTQIGKMTGHTSMLTSILMVGKLPVLISGDDSGSLRLWDIRTFSCLQSLNFGKKTQITKILDMSDINMLCFLGSRVNILKLDIRHNEEIENYAVKVEFDQQRDELIVATKKQIIFLDIYTGKIKTILNGLLSEFEDDITQFRPLNYFNKFILADSKGNAKIYHHNGEYISSLKGHSDINVLKLDILNKLIITACQDSILIQKMNGEILREITHFEASQLELSVHHSLILLSQGSKLYYIDYEFVKCLGVLEFDAEITNIIIIANYPLLAVSTIQGKVIFIKFNIKEHIQVDSELYDLYDVGSNNYITEETEQEFVTKMLFNLKELELLFATSESNIIRISLNLDDLSTTEPIHERINYNPLRKAREQLSQSETQKFIIPENFTSIKNLHMFKVSKKQIISISFLELDNRYILISTIDGQISIFDLIGNLIALYNINHPLPIKWNIQYSKQGELRKRIIYGFKVIDILRKQSKSEKEAEKYSLVESLAVTGRIQLKSPRQYKATVMRDEFSPRDLKFNKIRHLYQAEVQGPTLKQLEAQRRLVEVQNMFKDETKDPKLDLILKQKERERQKAIDRASNLNFLDPEFRDKSLLNTKFFQNNQYLTNLNLRLENTERQDYSQHTNKEINNNNNNKQNISLPITNRHHKSITKKKSVSDFYQYAVEKNLFNNDQNTIDTFASQSSLRPIQISTNRQMKSIGSSLISSDLTWHSQHRQQQKDLSTVLHNLNQKLRLSKNAQINEPILKDISRSDITFEEQIDEFTKRHKLK